MQNIQGAGDFLFNRRLLPKKVCNIKFALFLLCITAVGQSMMVTGALTVSINMIERTFGYSSVQTGTIDTVYNLAFGAAAFILGFMGKCKRMLWIGIGAAIMAMGCISFIIPIFMNTGMQNKPIKSIFCESVEQVSNGTCVPSTTLYLIIMCISYALIGIGASPLHTLAINYIDEYTTEGNGGLYTGIYYAFVALGPALTFLLSKPFLEIPVNLINNAETFLTHRSEDWIGAYWIVYIIGSIILLIIAIPLVLMPSSLPKIVTETYDLTNVSNDVEKEIVLVPEKYSFRSFIQSSKLLFLNYPFMLVNFGTFFEGIMSNAVATFLQKYIESQFSITSSNASLFSGALVVVGATLGLLLGGIIIKKYQWPVEPLILRISIGSFIGTLCLLFFLFNCPTYPIKGINIDNSKASNFTSQCSIDCHCDITHYMPICVDNKETYYSACVAGCTSNIGKLGSFEFSDCSCIENYVKGKTKVIEGSCNRTCNNFYFFMIFGFFVMIFGFIIYIPIITFTMRIVGDSLSLRGLGLQQLIIRISFVIGPVLYGLLIDNSCALLKPTEECKTSTNCLRYDLYKFSTYMLTMSICCKGVSTLFHLAAYYFVRKNNRRIQEKNNEIVLS